MCKERNEGVKENRNREMCRDRSGRDYPRQLCCRHIRGKGESRESDRREGRGGRKAGSLLSLLFSVTKTSPRHGQTGNFPPPPRHPLVHCYRVPLGVIPIPSKGKNGNLRDSER